MHMHMTSLSSEAMLLWSDSHARCLDARFVDARSLPHMVYTVRLLTATYPGSRWRKSTADYLLIYQ